MPVFCASVEQAFAFGIFADGVDVRIIRKAGDEFGPGFAKVAGLENERLEVVEFVRIDSHIGAGSIERRSFDEADHGPFGDFLEVTLAQVFPPSRVS